jgi:hypothetical protein
MPYVTRLIWDARNRRATREGVTVSLMGPPALAGAEVAEIDYIPCVIATIRRNPWDPMEEMTRLEVEAAEQLLRDLVPSQPAP